MMNNTPPLPLNEYVWVTDGNKLHIACRFTRSTVLYDPKGRKPYFYPDKIKKWAYMNTESKLKYKVPNIYPMKTLLDVMVNG